MEEFHIVDLKKGLNTKTNENYYYAILYSDLGYLVNAYLTNEEEYNLLKNLDFYDYDLRDILHKRYNKRTNNFSYYIELN